MSAADRAFARWLCEACGLVYDEARGDSDSGIAPGTRFEDIPDDWRCPVCGVTKADFRPLPPAPASAAADADGALAGRHAADRSRHGAQPRAAAAASGADAVVIVGAGAAGWETARAVRDAGWDGGVVLVTACDARVYAKPRLSVAFGRGIAPADLADGHPADHARALGVRLLPHTWALDLDVARRRLVTTRGTLRFAALVLATGARARPVAWPGSGGARVFAVNDLAAYRRLRDAWDRAVAHAQALRRAPRLAIVGAGLVGCELADDFAGTGAKVLLLDTAPLPLQPRLATQDALRLRDALAARGVAFEGEATLRAIDAATPDDPAHAPAAPGSGARLRWRDAQGRHRDHDADLVVAAVGVEPETALARRAGLTVDRGVCVDPHTLRCGDSPVFALGDCAQVDGRVGSTLEPISRQARAIAGAITGRPQPFEARPQVWVVKTPSLPLVIRPRTPMPANG